MNEQTQALRDCLDLIGRMVDAMLSGTLPAGNEVALPACTLRCRAGDTQAHHRKGTLTPLSREKWTPFETGFQANIGWPRKKENPAGSAL
jgi:hypothetical protein